MLFSTGQMQLRFPVLRKAVSLVAMFTRVELTTIIHLQILTSTGLTSQYVKELHGNIIYLSV